MKLKDLNKKLNESYKIWFWETEEDRDQGIAFSCDEEYTTPEEAIEACKDLVSSNN